MPLASRAKPVGEFRYIVAEPGNQTSPSIDGNYVVYAGPATDPANGIDVFLYDYVTPGARPVALGGGPGDQDSPAVFGTVVAFRDPTGIWIRAWGSQQLLRSGGDPAGSVASPSVGAYVAAWEFGQPGSRDIVVDRFNVGDEYVLSPPAGTIPGDQHGPAACGSLVAYVNEAAGGAVQVYDSDPGSRATQLLCPGRATGVSLGEYGTGVVAAVARAAGGYDEDVEVWDLKGTGLAALHVAGVQRNPHLSADWVAFEDLSTGRSQVVLWQWTTGLVFVPHPSESQQQLNDVYAGDGIVRVVFADDAAGNLDIALYQLTTSPTIPDDGLPSNWPPATTAPATCDPGGGTVLATLSLGRDRQQPDAAEAAFAADPAAGSASLPVLICVDAAHVSAAWIALDDEAVANPSQFNPDVVHLEVRSAVDGGKGRIAGVIAGTPGAALDVRVIADPARAAAPSGSALRAVPASAGSSSGCGTGGGLGSLVAVALAFLRRRR